MHMTGQAEQRGKIVPFSEKQKTIYSVIRCEKPVNVDSLITSPISVQKENDIRHNYLQLLMLTAKVTRSGISSMTTRSSEEHI